MFTLLVAVLAITGQSLILQSEENFPTREACEAKWAQVEPILRRPGAFANQDGPVEVKDLDHQCVEVEVPKGQERM